MNSQIMTPAHWKHLEDHHHGICLPLSSITTANSCGIGEYLDLIPLIKWLPKTGFDLIQLLPINDTGADPSPYMGVSSCALHPIYLSLRNLPNHSCVPGFAEKINKLSSLNGLERVDYAQVLDIKLSALSLYFDHLLPEIEKKSEFHTFVKANSFWLTSYSIFKALKIAHKGIAWWDWEKSAKFRTMDDDALSNEIMRWRAVQYLCFSQFKKVKKTADKHGILIKGDVPFLINKDSSDVWANPDLFDRRLSVGSPPDEYSRDGQHWGFPTYKWHNHRKNDFHWWKSRLQVQEQLYHIYRLDHIVGFFRLWAIPPKKNPKDGILIPERPEEWKSLGEEVLTNIVRSTTMLPIGEELGNIPTIVKESIHTLGIPAVKILRWERRYDGDRSFIHPSFYSPETLSTLTTHDTPIMTQWWSKHQAASQRLAHELNLPWQETLPPSTFFDLLTFSHNAGSRFHVNMFNELLTLFPELSWESADKERINIPGTTLPTNWTYRFKKPLEEICSHKGLLKNLQTLSSLT